MFRLVALITYANLLIKDLKSKLELRLHAGHQPATSHSPCCSLPTLLHTAAHVSHSSSSSYLRSHSNSPHRLHEDVAALQKFILGIHSDVWIQMRYPHTLVCLSSLWLGKELSHLHLEVGEYWNHHHPVVLFQYVFPQWRVIFKLLSRRTQSW